MDIPVVFILVLNLSFSFSFSLGSSGGGRGGGTRQNAGIVFVEECLVASAAEFGNAGLADGEES